MLADILDWPVFENEEIRIETMTHEILSKLLSAQKARSRLFEETADDEKKLYLYLCNSCGRYFGMCKKNPRLRNVCRHCGNDTISRDARVKTKNIKAILKNEAED